MICIASILWSFVHLVSFTGYWEPFQIQLESPIPQCSTAFLAHWKDPGITPFIFAFFDFLSAGTRLGYPFISQCPSEVYASHFLRGILVCSHTIFQRGQSLVSCTIPSGSLSNLTDKMKRSFFQAAIVSIQLYGCTSWTRTKGLEKKLDSNYTRMLRAILNKSWLQHPTRHQLYGHLPPITKTIQARRTRHAGHCWRSKDELIRDVLLWTLTYGQANEGRPARTYIQQLCEDTGCSPEHLPEAMNDREKWR